tara:strand:- start:48 stop:779 length:732 start_codon:yes stop_codon:yes gene_type:complete
MSSNTPHDINNFFIKLISRYNRKYSDYFKTIELPKKSENALVIVEPRCHQNLAFCIKNACYYCRGWSLYIFHSKSNREFVEKILGNKKDNVNLIEFCSDNITRNEYSSLLCSVDFWIKIKATNILIFQTDVHIRRFGVEEFLKYDYVGAPWKRNKIMFNSDIRVGNGGLSLRKKWQMIKIITKCSRKNYLKHFTIQNEDLYFAYYAKKLGLKVPHQNEAMKFSVERVYYNDPIGTHQAVYEIY